MKTIEYIREFLASFVQWASVREDVQAIALVGSYARDETRDDSDIDLVILTSQPENILKTLNGWNTSVRWRNIRSKTMGS